MPKRCNPFGNNLSPQLKTHVRDKEVNNGVCQQTRMLSVYEKTQKLLYTGMKEIQDRGINTDANDNFLSQRWEITTADKSDFKQMLIDKNCQLVAQEGSVSVDMETDSNSYHDFPGSYTMVSNLNSVSDAAETVLSGASGCSILSPFELKCEQNPSVPSDISTYLVPLCSGMPSASTTSNAFSHMKQAQLKNASSREPNISLTTCNSCRKAIQPVSMSRCQFCETCVCSTCVRQCSSCLLHFCQLCSVINYDLPSERSFCLNCVER